MQKQVCGFDIGNLLIMLMGTILLLFSANTCVDDYTWAILFKYRKLSILLSRVVACNKDI